jgi:hypothetical protein
MDADFFLCLLVFTKPLDCIVMCLPYYSNHKLALVIPVWEILLRCEPSSSPGCPNYHMQMAPVRKKHARKFVPIKCVLSGRNEPYLVVRHSRYTSFSGSLNWVWSKYHLLDKASTSSRLQDVSDWGRFLCPCTTRGIYCKKMVG